MILETPRERVGLLRAGFTGRDIEELYVIINSFEIVGVDWDGAVTKLAGTELEVRTPPSELSVASFSRLYPLQRVSSSVRRSLTEG